MTKLIASLAFLAALGSNALAASPAEAAAQHFKSIGAGDVAGLSAAYSDRAQLNWVGGPLDGTYTGAEAIRTVWEKFTKAQGALEVTVDKVEEAANPKGGTVTADVRFQGKQAIPVRYVLTYRDGQIVSETWQIDPKRAVAAH